MIYRRSKLLFGDCGGDISFHFHVFLGVLLENLDSYYI